MNVAACHDISSSESIVLAMSPELLSKTCAVDAVQQTIQVAEGPRVKLTISSTSSSTEGNTERKVCVVNVSVKSTQPGAGSRPTSMLANLASSCCLSISTAACSGEIPSGAYIPACSLDC